MLPIVIDPQYLKVLVSGDGPATKNRLKMLEDAGVTQVKYVRGEPNEGDFEEVNIAYIADFDDKTSERIAKVARSKNIILNIEDKKKFKLHYSIFGASGQSRTGTLVKETDFESCFDKSV